MTVSTEVTRVIVEGNGVTTSFAYSFPIPGSSLTDQTNAELILTDSAGTSTTLADNLWSLTGVVVTTPIDGTASGTFIYPLMGSPVSTGNFLTLNRIVPYEQETTLTGQGAYSPAVVETALDNLALQTEQNNTRLLQSLRVPITDAAISDYPPAAQRAGGFAGFDPVTGDAKILFGTPGSAIFVGTNSTSTSSVTTLLLTGSAVSSVTTASGVATATLNSSVGITDGVHTVSAATTLSFLNGTVGGSNPNATYTAPASGGGGLTLIATATANNTSTNSTFTNCFTSTYDDYIIKVSGLILATSTADLQFQFAVSGTPNASSNYFWFINWVNNAGTVANPNGGGVTLLKLVPSVGTDISQGTDLFLNVTQPLSTSNIKNIGGNIIGARTSDSHSQQGTFGGFLNVAGTAFDGFRISASSGNLVSGAIRVYGLQKS